MHKNLLNTEKPCETTSKIEKNSIYTKEQWKAFLKKANERIEYQKNTSGEENNESKENRDSKKEPNENEEKKTEDSYTRYIDGLVDYMKEYEQKHYKDLCDAYSICQKGKSNEFFDYHYETIDECRMKYFFKHCKVLVVTANPIEKATLHSFLCKDKVKKKIKRVIYESSVYYVFRWGEYWIAHVHQHQTGANKDLGMNTTINKALEIIKPNVIFSLGVAFGIDYETQKIGDVLVSRQIFPYSENKRDGRIVKPDRWQDKKIDNWLEVRLANANSFLDSVLYGDMLSGGSVMSSAFEKDVICAAYSENDFVIGGEMEGSAMFQVSNSFDIPCAVIKGICDWGVAKNNIFSIDKMVDNVSAEEWFKDSLQAYAMIEVIKKCELLFRDKALFKSTKNTVAENEKQKNKILLASNILLLVPVLTISFLCILFNELLSNICWSMILLGVGIVSLILFLASLFKRRGCKCQQRIETIEQKIIFKDFI